MMNWIINIADKKSPYSCEARNPVKRKNIDSHFRGNDSMIVRHSCGSRNPKLFLLISIATAFKSWFTIYPRPKERGNSIFLLGSS